MESAVVAHIGAAQNICYALLEYSEATLVAQTCKARDQMAPISYYTVLKNSA